MVPISLKLLISLSLICVACNCKWIQITTKQAHSIVAYDGRLLAATKEGLIIARNISSKFDSDADIQYDSFFHPKDKIRKVIIHHASDNNSKIFAIVNSTIFETPWDSEPYQWRRSLPESDTREIIDIHSGGGVIGYLAKLPVEGGDATKKNTIKSNVWLSNSNNLKDAEKCASFAASQIFIDSKGNTYTYGDIYGPYIPAIAVKKRDDTLWHHAKSLPSKNARISASDDVFYVLAAEFGLLKTYDSGRNFENTTKFGRIPTNKFTEVLASGKTVIVGTSDKGLYISSNRGATFIFHSGEGINSLPSNNVVTMTIDSSAASLFVATDAGIVAKLDLDQGEERKTEELSFSEKYLYRQEAKIVF